MGDAGRVMVAAHLRRGFPLVLLTLAVAAEAALQTTQAEGTLKSNNGTPDGLEQLKLTSTLGVDKLVKQDDDATDEDFVEVDSQSKATAKSKTKMRSRVKSKARSKMKFFGGGFFFFCDDSRRRRDDESKYDGDPDCSGFDCQNGQSRRRRSDDCSNGISSCLPVQSIVQTEQRGEVPITAVRVGDRVLTSDGYSEILFFAIRNPIARGKCWEISTINSTLVLTHSHAVFKADGTAVQVLHVDVGDELLSAGVVTGLKRTECTGLIAPITRAGTLVVNGVITSDYGPMAQMVGHGAAHALVMPIRAAKWASPLWEFWESVGKDGRHPLMAFGQYLMGGGPQAKTNKWGP